MDKKSLVSFMMVAPVAAFAQSNWVNGTGDDAGYLKYDVKANTNPGNWELLKGSGDMATSDGDLLTVSVGVGNLQHNNIGMLVGTYSFNYEGLTNAVIKVVDANGTRYLAKKFIDPTTGKDLGYERFEPKTLFTGKIQYTTNSPEEMIPLGKEGTFEAVCTAASSTLTLEVIRQDALKPYTIGEVSGKLNFNFKDCFDSFSTDLATIKAMIDTPITSKRKDDVKKLEDRKKGLNTTYNNLLNTVALINPNQTKGADGKTLTAEQIVDNMRTVFNSNNLYGFPEGKDSLTPKVSDLNTLADTYKKDVLAENEKYANTQKNNQYLNGSDGNSGLNGYVKELKNDVKNAQDALGGKLPTGVSGDLKAYMEYIKGNGVAKANKDIEAFQAAINEAFKDMTVVVSDDTLAALQQQYELLKNQIEALNFADAANDWNTYTFFVAADETVPEIIKNKYPAPFNNLTTVNNSFITNFDLVNKVVTRYKTIDNVYSDLVRTAVDEIKAVYNNNTGYSIDQTNAFKADGNLNPQNGNVAGAYENYGVANGEMQARIDKMEDIYDNLKGIQTEQDNAFNAAKAEYENAYNANELAGVFGSLTSSSFQSIANYKKLESSIKALQTAYNNWTSTTEKLYLAHNLDINAGDYATVKDAFENALTNYKTLTADPAFQGPIDAIVAVENARAKVNELTAKDSKYGTQLKGMYTPTLNDLQKLVNDYVKDPKDSSVRDNIVNSCKQLEQSCTNLCDAFANVEAKISNATSAADALESDINSAKTNNAKIVDYTVNGGAAYSVPQPYKFNKEGVYDAKGALTSTSVKTAVNADDATLADIAAGKEVKVNGTTYKCSNTDQAYQAATALSGKMTTDAYATSVNKARANFAKTVADKNQQAIAGLENYLGDKNSLSTYPGYKEAIKALTDGGFNQGGNEATGIATSISNAQSTFAGNYDNAAALKKYLDALSAVDAKCKNLANAYKTAFDKLQAVDKNHKAYVDLYDQCGEKLTYGGTASSHTTTSIYSQLAVVTVQPALAYYQGQLKLITDEIANERLSDKTKSTIYSNYQNVTAATNKATLQTMIDGFKTRMDKVLSDCVANQQAYTEIATEITKVSNFAEELKNDIEANDKVSDNKQKYLDEIAELTESLQKDARDASDDAFGAGKSVAEKENLLNKIKEIQTALENIKNGELQGYYQAVMDANKAFISNLNANDLNSLYKKYVENVNEYRAVNNPGYFADLMEDETFIASHSALQACHSDVEAYVLQMSTFLNSLVPGYVAGGNVADVRDNWVVLDQNVVAGDSKVAKDYKALTGEYDRIEDLINDTYTAVTKAAYEVASDFYNDNVTVGLNNYESIRSQYAALVGLDLEDEDDALAVGEALNAENVGQLTYYYDSIKNLYDSDPEEEKEGLDAVSASSDNAAKYKYILGMNAIANYNDHLVGGKTPTAFQDSKINKALGNKWSEVYNEVSAELKKYSDAVGTPVNVKQNELLEALTSAIDNVDKVNTAWNKLGENKYKANYTAKMAEMLNAATLKALEDGEKYYNENVVAGERKGFLNGVLPAIDEAAENLLEYSGYHKDQIDIYDNVENEINGYEAGVMTDPDFDENEDYWKDYADSLGGEFGIGSVDNYYAMFIAECQYAYDVLLNQKANAAFNNAKVNGADKTYLDAKDARLKAIGEEIDALLGVQIGDEAEDFSEASKDAFRTQILDLETELCNLIAELDSKSAVAADKTALGLAQAAVNGLLSNVGTTVDAFVKDVNDKAAASGEYGAAVLAEFGPKAEAIQNLYNGVKSDVENAANSVIMDEDEFKYKLNAIASEVADLLNAGNADSWKAAQDTATAYYQSDVAADKMLKEVNGLWNDVDFAHKAAVKAVVDQSTDADYQALNGYINGTNNTKGLLKSLEAKKAIHAFNANSTLSDVQSDYAYNFESKANQYVRETLTNVAYKTVNNDKSSIQGIIGGIENPGKNEKGWAYAYMNAGSLVSDLWSLHYEYDNINIWGDINAIYDADGSYERAKTAAEAKAAYEKLVNDFAEIMGNANAIKDGLEEYKILPGDVESDGDLNILDVQKLLSIIGEGVEADLDTKDGAVQNVNQSGVIDVADVTTLINMILSNNSYNSAQSKVARFLPAAHGNNSFRVEEVQGENGMRRFAVLLTNEVNFVAGQLDIQLPSHARVAGVSLGERANGLDAYVFDNGDYTRVIMTALDNTAIDGNNGCVLFIDVEGNAEIEVNNVTFSDANGNAHKVAENNSTVGVDFINGVKDGVKAIYNAAGQKLNKLNKGVNIIRNADGTVTKKIGK